MEGNNHQPEQQPTEPRIYAASLSDYNDGRLHGDWIKAAQEPEEIQEDIDEMLSRSPMPIAEEWAIHDYEGFASFKVSEYESLDIVSAVAKGIKAHGRAFAHWVDHASTQDKDALDHFEDHYLGHWNSLADYAEHLTEDLGVDLDRIVPGWIRPYVHIDYEMLGRDLATELSFSVDAEGVWVFEG